MLANWSSVNLYGRRIWKQFPLETTDLRFTTPEVNNMANPGFTFSEKMSGGFALGETNPQAGAKTGEAAGNTFTMHGTITIDDLDKFMTDPAHNGSLVGSINFN